MRNIIAEGYLQLLVSAYELRGAACFRVFTLTNLSRSTLASTPSIAIKFFGESFLGKRNIRSFSTDQAQENWMSNT
jgi:hypothetical protein